MQASKPIGNVLFALGVAALVGVAALLVVSRQGGGDSGWADLAAFAGALLLAAVAGLTLGLSLVAAWRGRVPLPNWRLALAALGCVVGIFAGGALALVAWESRNWGLISFGAFVVSAALFGLAGGVDVVQRRIAA